MEVTVYKKSGTYTTDGDHTSVCQGVETDVDSGHWSGGAKKEREDNSVLPLFFPFPLGGTRLLIVPSDCVVWPELLKLLWEGQEG